MTLESNHDLYHRCLKKNAGANLVGRTMARSVWDADGKAQATRFEAEVERKAKALLKANRKLAKDVTRWVDASMAIHEAGHEEKEKDAIGGGGVEESKGGDSANGIGGGEKSWLGSWFR